MLCWNKHSLSISAHELVADSLPASSLGNSISVVNQSRTVMLTDHCCECVPQCPVLTKKLTCKSMEWLHVCLYVRTWMLVCQNVFHRLERKPAARVHKKVWTLSVCQWEGERREQRDRGCNPPTSHTPGCQDTWGKLFNVQHLFTAHALSRYHFLCRMRHSLGWASHH